MLLPTAVKISDIASADRPRAPNKTGNGGTGGAVSGCMAKPLVSDDLWALIEPLLPPERPKPKGGRPPLPNRAALTGILFVLKSGLPWEMLPPEMGCGSGMTCWRRLREWQAAGVWDRLHRVLLDHLGWENAIDWSRACVEGGSVPAKKGRRDRPQSDRPRLRRVPAPPDQRRQGSPARLPAHRGKPP